ncbi:TPA: hypothetical protein KES96_002010, partial [Staphylococcus aureus]|nr:hypothetical protein [Staphylococcus aureus]
MDNSFLESLKEILEPYDDIESNKDGFVFGGYIDWPSFVDYEDFQVEEISTEDFIDSIMDYKVQIPTVDRLKSSITELFEKYEIPQGIQYEYDEGMPESSKYWSLEMDEDLYFIKEINFN